MQDSHNLNKVSIILLYYICNIVVIETQETGNKVKYSTQLCSWVCPNINKDNEMLVK